MEWLLPKKDQERLALHRYLIIPFGKLHSAAQAVGE